jgi:VWFA-related protein
MARRAIPALLALAATLHAQTDPTQSAVPGAGFGPPSTASKPAASPAPAATPTIHVFSRETIVDVLVTDDRGQPVTGLKQSDFTVLEDGKPMPIRGFAENTTSPLPPPPNLPPNTYTNATTLPASGPVQIILFDLIGTPPADIVRSKKYVADYLRSMPAETQVALFEFSPSRGLALLQGFTSDGRAAAAVVDGLDAEWINNGAYGVPIITGINGLNRIAQYVASIRGRKNLIWMIPNIPRPLQISRDGGYATFCVGEPPPDMSYVHQVMDLYDIFTREQIAIYPVDPGGVHGADCHTLRTDAVADDTGGGISNSNDFQSTIANIVDSTAHGYTLTYVPPRPAEDGHFHPIQIKVDRPGDHLSYRTGYNDEQPFPQDPAIIHDVAQSQMRLGVLPATQLLFNLQVTPAHPDATPSKVNITDKHHVGSPKDHLYNAVFTFDPTQIAFSETPDGKRTAKLEFDLGVFDNFSQLGPVRSQTITLNVSPSGYDDFMSKPFHFTLPVPLPSGQQTLRAGVFDTVSGKAGSLQVPLIIPKR